MRKIVAVLVIVGLLLVALWYFGILQDVLIKLGLMKPPEKIVITRLNKAYVYNELFEGTTYIVDLRGESWEPIWEGAWYVKPYVKYMLIVNVNGYNDVFFALHKLGYALTLFLETNGTYIINFTILEKHVKIYFEVKHLESGYEARFTIYLDKVVGWAEPIGDEVHEINYKLCSISETPKYVLECVCYEEINGTIVGCCEYRKIRPISVQVTHDERWKESSTPYYVDFAVKGGEYGMFRLVKIQEYVAPS